jgi:hypothetical protein
MRSRAIPTNDMTRRDQIPIFALSIGLCSALLYFALKPYHEAFGTFLYPLLGKGHHISGEGFSIPGSVPLSLHYSNVLHATILNPLFLIALVASATIIRLHGQSRISALTAITIGALFVFGAVIAVTTGGLAAFRYTAPVAIATLCSLGLTLAPELSRRLVLSRLPQTWLSVFIALTVALLLAGAFLVKGRHVTDVRLQAYEPTPDQILMISAARSWSDKSEGAVLLVGLEEARYIVQNLKKSYFIMDQPGMLSPSDRGITYGEGLAHFIQDKGIRTILLHSQTCDKTRLANVTAGWAGLAQLAADRNAAALCRLALSVTTHRQGDLLTLIIPSNFSAAPRS